jgi:hypothetical protein
MSKEMTKTEPLAMTGKALEEFVVRGNLAALSPTDKAAHYIQLCHSLGLNPATKPFEYITLQGKETLYARRDATEQLRKIHNVSLDITGRESVGDVYVVTARATMPDGRRDESTGVVSIVGLKGEALANKLMSCETKAKRRVTLSIVGLGILDESEFDTIPTDRFARLAPEAPKAAQVVQIEKKAQDVPPPPRNIESVPDWMAKRIKPLAGLAGVPFYDMDDDDVDLVIDACTKSLEQKRAAKTLSENGGAWLLGIISVAKIVAQSRAGGDEPPDYPDDMRGEESFIMPDLGDK